MTLGETLRTLIYPPMVGAVKLFARLGVLMSAVAVLLPGTAFADAPAWWRPVASASLTWQIQFTGTVDLSVKVAVFDLDGDATTARQVKALHARKARVICYVSAGSSEDWRSDAAAFPASVLGSDLAGWPGEKWLDVRRWDVLGPIMKARFRVCAANGFDAVDPDNLDGYANANGVGLTAADQALYNKRIAGLAHSLGLAVGLKNDLDQVPALVRSFDFAVNEQCAYYRECGLLTPFVTASKPVFEIEYGGSCAGRGGFTPIRKHLSLDAWRRTCPS